MSYDDRKGGKRNDHPLAQVAAMVADDMRALAAAPAEVQPIAWITEHGDLYCGACVQPTLAQREVWLGVDLDGAGRVDRCDLCDRPVKP